MKPKEHEVKDLNNLSAIKRSSLDSIQSRLQGMLVVVKDYQEQSTQTRMRGTNPNTKMRQSKTEDGKSKVKEVKTGKRFNLQSRVGDPALRKADFSSLDTSLDVLKSIFNDS